MGLRSSMIETHFLKQNNSLIDIKIQKIIAFFLWFYNTQLKLWIKLRLILSYSFWKSTLVISQNWHVKEITQYIILLKSIWRKSFKTEGSFLYRACRKYGDQQSTSQLHVLFYTWEKKPWKIQKKKNKFIVIYHSFGDELCYIPASVGFIVSKICLHF